MKERSGEISEESALICHSLNCPLVQEQPYPMCQAKVQIDRGGERKNIGSQVASDYGTMIPVGCPEGYDKFRKQFRDTDNQNTEI